MNRSQFFQTVKLSRANVEVVQDGDKGFKLIAFVQHNEEPRIEIVLLYKDEPRYFKGLTAVGDIMREYEIDTFTVKISKEEVATKTRSTTVKKAENNTSTSQKK